ncbi:hypothetical protein BX661DRAFT_18473 [Kickxella alabastrina]|uniref:uncharacterized protein n=1 Tax=Kickxella alabastrina TaxID=61397 RepID=UPI0022208E29|nr:uncharacterized protein BX661DRAFT_18473 [Kickxella alabastrina]KAI7827880.1 hypothetical protein BX661DRAFT_18473 [Kickxella alabastrina]
MPRLPPPLPSCEPTSPFPPSFERVLSFLRNACARARLQKDQHKSSHQQFHSCFPKNIIFIFSSNWLHQAGFYFLLNKRTFGIVITSCPCPYPGNKSICMVLLGFSFPFYLLSFPRYISLQYCTFILVSHFISVWYARPFCLISIRFFFLVFLPSLSMKKAILITRWIPFACATLRTENSFFHCFIFFFCLSIRCSTFLFCSISLLRHIYIHTPTIPCFCLPEQLIIIQRN